MDDAVHGLLLRQGFVRRGATDTLLRAEGSRSPRAAGQCRPRRVSIIAGYRRGFRFVGFFNRFRIDHPGVEITLTEAAPATLTEQLQAGELDVAILARPDPFDVRLRAEALYRERFVVACAVGHEFARRNRIGMADMDGQTYLLRINCAFRDHLSEHTAACGARVNRVFRSEREDWIQTMVAAGMGVCFIPEFSATHPGIVLRRVEPEVTREVSLVTVPGRRWSTPMASFVQAIRRYGWPTEQDADIAGRLAPPGASALRMA